MLKDKNEKIVLTKNNFILIIIILVLGVVVALYLANLLSNMTEEKYEKSISVSERLSNIKDNYNIKVTKIQNDESVSMNVSCDENVCIYKSDSFNSKEIIKYNSKYYTLSNFDDMENAELVKINDSEVDDIFNSKYYDLELIKSIIEVSSREKSENSNILVNVSLVRYLKEYNYLYNEINKTDLDTNINITITNGISNIRSISIDYKDIDNYFNNTNYDVLTYKIDIDSVNNVDYSFLREYIDNK